MRVILAPSTKGAKLAQLTFIGASGQSVYAVLLNVAGDWWNGGAVTFETYQSGHLGSYALALVEAGSSGIYSVDLPGALPAGPTTAVYRRKFGTFPAETDPNVGAETFTVGASELDQVAAEIDEIHSQVVGVAT